MNPAVRKAARRAAAKGRRWGDEGVGEAWRAEEEVGRRKVWRPERVVVKGCGSGGGGSSAGMFVSSETAVGGAGEPAELKLTLRSGAAAAPSMRGISRLLR